MPLRPDRVALNAIQWTNVKADPADPDSEDVWLYGEPSFVADYPRVLGEIARAGFDAVMMEVLATQTLQSFARMIDDAGLRLAPGYVQIGLPEDEGHDIVPGTAAWVHWFDLVRRRAEESNYFGLSTVFLSAPMLWSPPSRTVSQVAVGADFDPARLARITDLLGEAATVLKAEGVHAGLHNHIGSWIETEAEIDYVLDQIEPSLLGASFDVGHLEWAGIEAAPMLRRYSSRLLDLHVKDLDLQVAARSRREPGPYRYWADRRLFLEPGLGDVDLDAVLDAIPADFPGWMIIEVDRASMDPFESALVTRRWLDAHIPH